MKKRVSSFIVRWRRRSSQKHLSGWDVPTYDPNSGDLTGVRDVVAELIETDRLRKTRTLP